jgi:hypothetical protein
LQHEVEEDDRFTEVMEEVAQAAADRARDDFLIGECDRRNDRLIDLLSDLERRGIEFLEWVGGVVSTPGDDDLPKSFSWGGDRRLKLCR